MRRLLAKLAALVLAASYAVAPAWAQDGLSVPGAPSIGAVGVHVPSAAAAAVAYLPAITATRLAVLSSYKLVSGYAGPLMDVADAEAATTTPIYPVAGGQAPDLSALNPAHTLTVTKLYDQTGAGYDHAPNGTASESAPALRLTGQVRGKQGVSWFDGISGTAITALTNTSLPFTTKGGFAFLDVWAPSLVGYRQSIGGFGVNNTAPLANPALDRVAGSGFFVQQGTSYGGTLVYPRTQTEIISLSSASTTGASATRVDSVKFAYDGGMSSGSNTGSQIGRNTNASAPVPRVNGEFFARIVYSAPLGDADYAAEQAVLATVFDIQDTATNAVLLDGDSRTLGYGTFAASEPRATRGLNLTRQLDPLLSKRVLLTNIGISGQTIATMNAANGRANVTKEKRSASAKNILVVTAGINDISGVASGSISGFGSSLYTNQLLPYVQAAQAAGFTVIVGTIYHSGSFADNSTARNAEVDSYNTAIRNGASTNSYTVADFAGLAHASSTANTAYFSDQLHQTSALIADEAALLAPIVNGALQ